MSNNVIDAKMLSKMFMTGAKNLEAKKEWTQRLLFLFHSTFRI